MNNTWINATLEAIQHDWNTKDREGAICWIESAYQYAGVDSEEIKAAWSLLNEDHKFRLSFHGYFECLGGVDRRDFTNLTAAVEAAENCRYASHILVFDEDGELVYQK